MGTYVTLITYNRAGHQAIKEAPDRTQRAIEMAPQLGIEVKNVYWLMGQYDALLIVEAPDAESASRVALLGASQGHGSTETMRAFAIDEFREIVKGLPG